MESIAVIGTGSAGMQHLRVLRQQPGIHPIAIPKRPERIAQLEAEGFRVARTLRQARDLGACFGIVASDTGQHLRDGLAAVEEGWDLLVEKPMAMNANDAGQLWEEGKRAGRKIYVGCTLRFSESLNLFCRHLASIGSIHTVHVECESYLPDWRPSRPYRASYSARAAEGGVLRDLIHEIDYVGWIFGWPSAVSARIRNLGRLDISSEEICHLSLSLPKDCMALISLDYLSRPPRRCIRARGERGTLEWDGLSNAVTLAVEGEAVQSWTSRQTRDEMFLAQDMAFASAGASVADERLATAEDGLKALAVCDAARRSSDEHREERVGYS